MVGPEIRVNTISPGLLETVSIDRVPHTVTKGRELTARFEGMGFAVHG